MSRDPDVRAHEISALATLARAIYEGFVTESLNGVVCSIPDGGVTTALHRTWCARCQRRYLRLLELAESLEKLAAVRAIPTPKVDCGCDGPTRPCPQHMYAAPHAPDPLREQIETTATGNAANFALAETRTPEEHLEQLKHLAWLYRDEESRIRSQGHWASADFRSKKADAIEWAFKEIASLNEQIDYLEKRCV